MPHAACFQDLHNQAERAATPDANALANTLLNNEIAKCGGMDDMKLCDRGISNHLASCHVIKRVRNRVGLLQALYWRAHQQSAVLNLFWELVALGLVNPEALKFPIDLESRSEACQSLEWHLGCFELPYYENQVDCDDEPYELWGSRAFNAPLRWLATMIVRGCTGDAGKIMEVVAESRCLGPLNMKAYDVYLRLCKNKSFTPNLDEGLLEVPRLPPFGFWLLHDIPVKDWTDECVGVVRCKYISQFDHIENVYKQFFKFPDEIIMPPDV
ncbi:MAG: hypothetical protein LQ339_007842 [Xanthoria mediterranea]|nr:MAG: hypothetical protein LQ339_007842 [Xanthoria mediterranea]